MSRAARVRAFLAAAPEIGPGTLVTERVRLKEVIATGGMGTVWRAEHTTLGVDVAVKLLTDDVRDDPDALTRFRNEASTASRLTSAHVVKILDFGLFEEETPFLVMELLVGEDLASLLSREGPLPLAQVSDIVTQAARGLTAAHEVGCIHRDVKPQNLFLASVDGEKVVKLLDFGVARRPVVASRAASKSGQLVGTPLYMGPEQLTTPAAIDARADLWALAVVAYEALTGDLPFKGETVGALAIAVDRGELTPPSKRVGVGPSVDRWFEKAFAREIGRRFQTADELATAFRAAVAARPSRRMWPFALTLAVVAAVVAFAVTSLRSRPPPAGSAAVLPAPRESTVALADRGAVITAAPRSASGSAAAEEPSASPTAARKASPKSTTARSAGAPATVSDPPRKDRGF
ncbi:MAG: protein kinase [Myxococcales bacterium]|nr:protein kinase [Myxococcales bacterium]